MASQHLLCVMYFLNDDILLGTVPTGNPETQLNVYTSAPQSLALHRVIKQQTHGKVPGKVFNRKNVYLKTFPILRKDRAAHYQTSVRNLYSQIVFRRTLRDEIFTNKPRMGYIKTFYSTQKWKKRKATKIIFIIPIERKLF